MKVTLHQLQEQLPALLEQTVQSGEECIVQRQGKDYAVLVSARVWRQRMSRLSPLLRRRVQRLLG